MGLFTKDKENYGTSYYSECQRNRLEPESAEKVF